MKKVKIIFYFLVLVQFSCLKKYNCHCGDANSPNTGSNFIVKGTKKNAEKKCAEYSHENEYPHPPTTCKIEE
jgi:hypothetical protein